ncbi:helix-turn-helix domain-containing protein [Scytonema sp. UIC 10036]|uniref:helix-turn-helix domain-containing protein n=1 Tax=Scytonema sp. UIC 10036 TaxID=2304196 RepID=UPI0012DA384F|nr:helix-turn-helix transcriptional regulator [Scytonema sp. UIC 10036]MUG96570.1 helix-turn-helix domain-containing protein [Scytonema sp. UIC 10036]
MDHQQILIKAIRESGLTAREISEATGVNESSLSRFINGKQDLRAGDYFAVLNFLPEEAKNPAKCRLSIDSSVSLKMLIMQATDTEKAEVLFALGHLFLKEHKSTEAVDLLPAAS